VAIHRRLFAIKPGAHRLTLAASLTVHGWVCMHVRRHFARGLRSVAEAVRLWAGREPSNPTGAATGGIDPVAGREP
jgi:hypothetical protein